MAISENAPNFQQLLTEAEKLGAYAAGVAGELSGKFAQPGDDTGRCAAMAFRTHGPEAAAQVFVTFMRSYNTTAHSSGAEPISRERLVSTCAFALAPVLNNDEIKRVQHALMPESPGAGNGAAKP